MTTTTAMTARHDDGNSGATKVMTPLTATSNDSIDQDDHKALIETTGKVRIAFAFAKTCDAPWLKMSPPK